MPKPASDPRHDGRRRAAVAATLALLVVGGAALSAGARAGSPAKRPAAVARTMHSGAGVIRTPKVVRRAPVPGSAAGSTSDAPPTPTAAPSAPTATPSAPAAAPSAPTTASTAASTLFGADVYVGAGTTFANDLTSEDTKLGHLPVVRTYFSGLPTKWPLGTDGSGRTLVVSFKALPSDVLSGADDTTLEAWFASAPSDESIYWSYWHEPEDDIARGSFTASAYRSAWAHLATLAAQAHKSNLHATLILMNWTLNPASGRTFADYYPGAGVIQALGWDAYNEGASKGVYDTPAQIFAPAIALSTSLHLPFGIAETGSLLVSGDSGAGRAAWLGQVGSYLRQQGASWVTYFDAPVGGKFMLDDAPSQRAWGALVRS